MRAKLDLEDVVSGHPKAAGELSELHAELEELRAYKKRVRESYISLMMGKTIPMETDGVFHIDAGQLRKHRDVIMGSDEGDVLDGRVATRVSYENGELVQKPVYPEEFYKSDKGDS